MERQLRGAVRELSVRRICRARVAGPLGNKVAVGFSVGRSERDGFTTNALTGATSTIGRGRSSRRRCCSRRAADWEARVIVSGERARDGDYALNDLGALRSSSVPGGPRLRGADRSRRDLDDRARAARGARLSLSSDDRHRQLEDGGPDRPRLHAAAAHHPRERARRRRSSRRRCGWRPRPRRQCGCRIRRCCAGRPACSSSRRTTIRTAVNSFAPFVLSPFVTFPVASTRRRRRSTMWGSASTARATFTIRGTLDVTVGARVDHEQKDARLETFFTPTDQRAVQRVTPTAASPACRRRRRWPTACRVAPDGLRVGRARVQGGWLQPGVAGWAASRTARSTPGTSRAGSRPRGRTGGSPPTRRCS